MSVRDFANHPCPVCKSDTLHIAMRCKTCGHQTINPHEQFERITEKLTDPRVPKKHLIPEELRERYSKAKNKRNQIKHLRAATKRKDRDQANRRYRNTSIRNPRLLSEP